MEDPAHGPSGKKDSKESSDMSLWRLVGLGMQLAVTVGIFAALGWWLDGKYGWAPWGMMASAAFGIVLGLYHFVKEALRER